MSDAKTVVFEFHATSYDESSGKPQKVQALKEWGDEEEGGVYRFLAKRFISSCTLLVAALCTVVLGTSSAYAHEAGDWLVRLGVTQISPKSDNGSVLNGAVDLDVGSNIRPSFTIAYMATQHVGVELLGVLPYRHNIHGSGGLGRIGATEQLPPTFSVQWHFLPDSTVQPYVGVGVNYTHFFDTDARGPLAGSDLKLEDSWGIAGQLGVDIKLDDRWFVSADLRYIDISSEVKLDGRHVGTARIDPWVTTVSVGYRF